MIPSPPHLSTTGITHSLWLTCVWSTQVPILKIGWGLTQTPQHSLPLPKLVVPCIVNTLQASFRCLLLLCPFLCKRDWVRYCTARAIQSILPSLWPSTQTRQWTPLHPSCTSVNNCPECIYNVQGICAVLKVISNDSTIVAVGRDIILYHRQLLETEALHMNRWIVTNNPQYTIRYKCD